MPGEESAISLLRKNWRAAIPLTFLFLAAGYFGVREFWRWYGINEEYTSAFREVDGLEKVSEALKRELVKAGHPQVLEKEARAKLNLKKEGESVLVVVSDDSFPEENFLDLRSPSRFDRAGSVWFNLKSWREYFFP